MNTASITQTDSFWGDGDAIQHHFNRLSNVLFVIFIFCLKEHWLNRFSKNIIFFDSSINRLTLCLKNNKQTQSYQTIASSAGNSVNINVVQLQQISDKTHVMLCGQKDWSHQEISTTAVTTMLLRERSRKKYIYMFLVYNTVSIQINNTLVPIN